LLEVGTGFHPELTGRENIFLNGAILGMRKAEIARKFDEIVEFSGCARYIDTPVKRYSSGMYVRLAFAVAAHLEPEILIVDEVLAVGDAEFQKKCLGKMKDVAGHGRTVLFVSHNMGAVLSLCDNAISFNNGRLIENGDVRIVVDKYLLNNEKKNIKIVNISKINRAGYFGAKLLLDKIEWESLPLKHGEPASASIYFTVFEDVLNASIGMSFCTPEGTRLLTIDSDFQGESRKNIKKGFHKVNFNIPTICTSPGIYSIEIGARSSDSFMLDYVSDCCQVEVFIGKNSPNYISSHGIGIRLPSQWNWELKG
jgi:lipopolysaccharide transport system ATP-binding protein